MGLINEKNRVRKSCDTAPLKERKRMMRSERKRMRCPTVTGIAHIGKAI